MTEYLLNIDSNNQTVTSGAGNFRIARYDDWNSIIQFPDFQEDEDWIRKKFADSIGSSAVATKDTALIKVVVRVITTLRWFARRLPESKDIDLTPFLERILGDVGLHLPVTKELPTIEWIREAKNWNEHKGTPGLVTFIGDLIGSPISINYPQDLIFTVGGKRSCVSGAYNLKTALGGTPTTGESVTVAVDGSIGPGSVTYALTSGESLSAASAGLVSAINNSIFFQLVGITAFVYNTDVIIETTNTINFQTSVSGTNITITQPISIGGDMPWDLSKHARIRDGIYWSQFVYVVRVLAAQAVIPVGDLIKMLDSVHPAGMKRFLELDYMILGPSPDPGITTGLLYTILRDFLYLKHPHWPTLDNGLKTSDAGSLLDMHGGKLSRDLWDFISVPLLHDSGFRRLSSSIIFLNPRIHSNKPWQTFKRDVPDYSTGQAGNYKTVYADNDSIVFENSRTNIGIGYYPASDLGYLTLRELGYAAIDNEKANMRGTWLRDLPNAWTEVVDLATPMEFDYSLAVTPTVDKKVEKDLDLVGSVTF